MIKSLELNTINSHWRLFFNSCRVSGTKIKQCEYFCIDGRKSYKLLEKQIKNRFKIVNENKPSGWINNIKFVLMSDKTDVKYTGIFCFSSRCSIQTGMCRQYRNTHMKSQPPSVPLDILEYLHLAQASKGTQN